MNHSIMENYRRRKEGIIWRANRGYVKLADQELDDYAFHVISAIAEQDVDAKQLAEWVHECQEAVAAAETHPLPESELKR